MGEVLDLFSAAAGGWSLGMHRAGFTTIAACEVEAWRRAIYSENNPGVKVYDDVRTLTASRLRDDLGRLPSVVVGSPPCQDISSANTKGRGVEGERSGLFFEAIRLVGEIRPRWVALENSSNLRTRGADAVIAALEELGYSCWPLVVRAGDIGANHERPRCWLLACNVEQVTDADHQSHWRAEQSRPEGQGCHLSGDGSALGNLSGPHGAGAVSRGYGGLGKTANADGLGSGLSRGRAGAITGAEQQTCGDASDAGEPVSIGRDADGGRRGRPEGAQGIGPLGRDLREAGRNTPDPDQAGQAHGCMEPGLRQAAIADDGRGAGRSGDGEGPGQMGLCTPDSGDADRSGPDWSLAHLADHLRLDDGLSARLAGTRVDVGDGKGQSAASLVVEAFGDAVVPQIPEAIGRAIIRTERALAAIYQTEAA